MTKVPETQKEVLEAMNDLALKNAKITKSASTRKDIKETLKNSMKSLIKAQVEYEKMRKNPDWEKIPQEGRDTLDEMSGGLWLKGNELELIEKI